MILPTSGTLAGTLTSPAASDLGLRSGLPVAAGAADSAAAALGSGLTETGDVQLTIGTGIQLVTPLNGPVLPGPDAGWPVVHCYRAATDVGHYAMAASLNGGSTLGWVREILGVSWAELYAAANHRPAPGDGLVSYPTCTASGPRTWTRRCVAAGSDCRPSTPGPTCYTPPCSAWPAPRAKRSTRWWRSNPPPPSGHCGSPAAARCPYLAPVLADVLGRELAAVEVPSASARGAAFLGGRAAGLITDSDRSALRAELGPTTTPSPDTAFCHDGTFAAFQAALARTRSMPPSSSSTAWQS